MGVEEESQEPGVLWRAAPPALTLEDHKILADVRASLFSRAPSPLKVGRYAIGEPLGQGGCGVVFRARDPSLGRDVAIKFVRTSPEDVGLDGQARMRTEARALARLEHPNVVSVFDVGDYDGREHPGLGALGPDVPASGMFVAMELVDGLTLRDWLARPRDTHEVIAVFRQCALGLAAAHEVGLVHRDFKPANVLVTEAGIAKVLDFGLATQAPRSSPDWSGVDSGDLERSHTRSGVVLGTPWTMAPEQYEGKRCDARTDQYTLAFCMHEALFGRTDVPNLKALIAAKRAGPLPRGRSRAIPAWLARALTRATDPSTDARFATMRAWLHATDPVATRQRRIRLAGLGLAAVVCIGLIALATLGPAPTPAPTDPGQRVAASTAAMPALIPDAVSQGFEALAQGDWETASKICSAHVDRPGSIGAAALLCLAEAEGEAGDTDRSAASSERAYWLALESERPYLAARAAVGAALQHTRATRRDEARRWIGHAKSTLDRSQADPEALAADLQIVEASIVTSERTPQEAVPLYEAAHGTLLAALGPADRRTLRADLLAGNALQNAKQQDAALVRQNRALAGFRTLHGDGPHLDIARALNDRATTLFDVDRLDDALGDLEEGLGMAVASEQGRHPTAGMLHHNLGYALNMKGRPEDAISHYRDAIAIREAALGPHHLKVLKGMGNQANSLLKLGRLDEAEQLAEATLSRYEERGIHRLMRKVMRTISNIAEARGDPTGEARARERLDKLDEQLAARGLL